MAVSYLFTGCPNRATDLCLAETGHTLKMEEKNMTEKKIKTIGVLTSGGDAPGRMPPSAPWSEEV